jgi:hypothetical protein
MKRELASWFAIVLGVLTALAGCSTRNTRCDRPAEPVDYAQATLKIEYPDAEPPCTPELLGSGGPRTIEDAMTVEYRPMTLDEAIAGALSHSKVMIDLGGTVLRVPEAIPTTFGPAVQETDPQFGVPGALSAFDAQFATSAFFEQNDRQYNNTFLGRGGLFNQDYDVIQAEITKREVTGSQVAIRHNVAFDENNNVGNIFGNGAWDAYIEGEIRHPLLQGGGVEFNRIAGPGAKPGVYNGVLIARVRGDISLTDFEIGVRDLVANVENAYWDLYFAYRDLDSKREMYNASLDLWRKVSARHGQDMQGGEAAKEAQAREQFYRFEEELKNALMGRPLEGTRTNDGTTPGTFRGLPGVFTAERRLRLLLGMPPADRQLIRPSTEPPIAHFTPDWNQCAATALVRREELRRQRWHIKGRELELVASRNFLYPNLDVIGRYRWRGFGEDLLPSNQRTGPEFSNAYANLTGGDFQEWQAGVELSMPIGFRQAHTAVRNAELRLTQARCVLREQERQVVNDLSTAVAEVNRSYSVLQTSMDRFKAASDQLRALEASYEAGTTDIYILLDAQRRHVDAQSTYYQARVEYALALRNVCFENGTLLEYCRIGLNEGLSPSKAYEDAARRERFRGHAMEIDYRFHDPLVVSRGPVANEDTSVYMRPDAGIDREPREPIPLEPNRQPPNDSSPLGPPPSPSPSDQSAQGEPFMPNLPAAPPLNESVGDVIPQAPSVEEPPTLIAQPLRVNQPPLGESPPDLPPLRE